MLPGSAQAHFNLGLAQWATGDIESAYVSFKEARRLDPSSLPAQARLGMAASALGHHQEAVPLLERAAKAAPGDGKLQDYLRLAKEKSARAGQSKPVPR